MAGNGKEKKINLTLNVWRQKNRNSPGRFETYPAATSARTCRSSRCSTWSTSG